MKVKFKLFGIYTGIVLSLGAMTGCRKFVTAEPPKTQLLSTGVFSSDATANSAVAGMYSYMYQLNNASSTYGGYHLTICTALSADELYRPALPADPFYTNNLSPASLDVARIWASSYGIIYNANAVLEGLQTSTSVSASMKAQLAGEALFIRAFCHFYLVNLFGDVPLVTTTNVKQSIVVGRSSKDSVYKQIIADLEQAKSTLATNYSFSGNERVRANKWVASAFLARVYLYTGDWANAEAQATAVINNSSLYSLPANLNSVFLKSSNEAIWQFLSYTGSGYTIAGSQLLPASYTVAPAYALTSFQQNAFETGDQRKIAWTNSYTASGQAYVIPFKYKQRTNASGTGGEYDMVLRLAEQYLIRAEARVQLNNLSGSKEDINAIRARAGLPGTSANDRASMLLAVDHERQAELFTEWGHRWLDLKRTGRINTVLSAEKPAWVASKALFPIPTTELANNPALSQNAGY
ncbi:MAG: RagB/SusD family nutrient uptake outer membrane protein [Williamsia sp.]|nr:RagB/SusD family nutrient uptake outer membrane protein [Williamsia sp.]